MAKYEIKITQVWEHAGFVEAGSRAEADALAEEMARGMTPANSMMDFKSQSVEVRKTSIQRGDRIRIISMDGEPSYNGKCGVVDHVDDFGQIHGTWGGCALIPGVDEYKVIN